ncbi:YtxH domain-containing protein [Saccharibacillus alkalitolerans]|uniref:General stress protein n=1 Tax=Saccharibacillus alkalitolerans TaxID=2705290 RepID=A0ABX0F0H1_9BACL|nr:YtxH domain-containing protein [Saccharibacillus alkalitolerans]NGZ74030.1 hypothetical protein [Saccharibacillus alkalitolerans]
MSNQTLKFIAGLAAGAAVGGAAALLFAPQRGTDTRQLLAEKAVDLKDKSLELKDKGVVAAIDLKDKSVVTAIDLKDKSLTTAASLRDKGQASLYTAKDKGQSAIAALRVKGQIAADKSRELIAFGKEVGEVAMEWKTEIEAAVRDLKVELDRFQREQENDTQLQDDIAKLKKQTQETAAVVKNAQARISSAGS